MTPMIHHRLGLALSLPLALALSACALFAGLVKSEGPAICKSLMTVYVPGSDAIAAVVCPEVAAELSALLAAEGDAGRAGRRSGECRPLSADLVIAESPRGAYLCTGAGRIGSEAKARELYMLAHKLAATKRLAKDGGQ